MMEGLTGVMDVNTSELDEVHCVPCVMGGKKMGKTQFTFIEELSASSEGAFIHSVDKYLCTDIHVQITQGNLPGKWVENGMASAGFQINPLLVSCREPCFSSSSEHG